MIVTTPSEADKVNIVMKSPKDLAFSLDVKRERQRNRQFTPIGGVEEIIFEVDRDCTLDDPRYVQRLGRKLYWRERMPMIARTIPEEDLIFTQPLPLKDGYVWLPEIFDPLHGKLNPYETDSRGHSKLHVRGELVGKPHMPKLIRQPIERIASALYRNFLVFHPVAQITVVMAMHGRMTYGSFGDHRQPISSLSGRDGRKMALLIDPYNGEIFFTGGAYGFDSHYASEEDLRKATDKTRGEAKQ